MSMPQFELVKYKHPNELKYSARCPELGLTAYGDTEEEAWMDLKKMFIYAIDLNVKYQSYREVIK